MVVFNYVTLKNLLPSGWKIVKAQNDYGKTQLFIVNTKGETFETLEEAQDEILEERKDILPLGWKVIKARYGGGDTSYTIILSPQGKKFETLEDVLEHLEEEKKPRKASKRTMILRQLYEAEDTPLAVSDIILKRRKLLSMRSRTRNLLKKTLEKVHKINSIKDDRCEILKSFGFMKSRKTTKGI